MPNPIDISLLTEEEKVKLLQEASRRLGSSWNFSSLEELIISREGFGLETATPLQRAICRIIGGQDLAELAEEKTVIEALNTHEKLNLAAPPAEVTIVAAVRTAKSMIAAAVAIWASQKCNLDGLKKGEIPRFSILSLTLDNAKVVLLHLLGALSQPRLKGLRLMEQDMGHWKDLITETGADVVGSEFLWHPSNRPVEIRVVAGSRAGGSLVSRWSIGAVLDEAPRMVGSSDAVINYDDARRAVRSRLLPGAQILSIGSPWQPYGPIYDIVREQWGYPTQDRVIIKAPGPHMNPFWWTPERCEELKRSDPTAYQTDVLADFADSEESLFPQMLLERCVRREPLVLPPEPNHDYSAAMDPATRGNAWTLVIADRIGNKKRIVYARQWIGSTLLPLSPREVLEEMQPILAGYGLDWCYTDQWAADAIKDLAATIGLFLIIEDWNVENKVNAFQCLAANMALGQVEIPNLPILLKDLKLTKKKPTQRGVTIHFERTSDGRHCDFSPALARCLHRWIQDVQEEIPTYGTKAYWDYWEEETIAREEEELEDRMSKEWWEYDPYGGEEPWEDFIETYLCGGRRR